jgi:hypothetical protein
MEEKLIEKTDLDNKALLEIYDASRVLIGDRWLVVLAAKVQIAVASLYDNEKSHELPGPEKISELLGDPLVWKHSRQRRFIDKSEKEQVFAALRADFDKNMRQYLMHPLFPVKFTLKQLEDKKKRSAWYK